jgi:hypothetical protein
MNSNQLNNQAFDNEPGEITLRKSSQFLMPVKLNQDTIIEGIYNIYPACSLGGNKIFNGYDSLAKWIMEQKTIIIDGYAGVFWDKVKSALQQQITAEGLKVNWIDTEAFLKPVSEIETMVQPYLGAADSVWGTKCLLELKDLYVFEELAAQLPDGDCDINIVIGTAASLINWGSKK